MTKKKKKKSYAKGINLQMGRRKANTMIRYSLQAINLQDHTS